MRFLRPRKTRPSATDESEVSRNFDLGDRFRDRGQLAEASRYYGLALAAAPTRTDIKMQLANMLKDTRRFEEAERYYREALVENPGDADCHLQLGHLLKTIGRRTEALDSYRRALALDPLQGGARRELAAAGETAARIEAYEQQMRDGGVETLLTIRASLDDIGRRISEMRASLPDAEASVAFPVDVYAEMRRLFDCPAPGAIEATPSIAIVLLADREPLERLYAQLSAISDQSHSRWSLQVVGADADRREIAERAAARDPRIAWLAVGPNDRLAALEVRAGVEARADWVLLLAAGACLHRHALAWITAAAARTGAQAVITDEEVGEAGDDGGALRPILRHLVDRDSIREANVYGESVAVATPSLAAVADMGDAASIAEARARLLLAVIEGGQVAHVPLPLIRTTGGEPIPPETLAATHAAALKAHMGEQVDLTVAPSPWSPAVLRVIAAPRSPDTPIAVIIPTRDNGLDVENMVESLLALAARPRALEIIIVNNGRPLSDDRLLAKVAALDGVRAMEMPEPFNWSRFNNLAAAATTAPYLVFANDDMRMLSQDWDTVVRSFLERDEVGALGARLRYGDDTIQHAGVLFDWRGSVIHDGLYRAAAEAGPARRWHLTRSVSAVTGAFLATRRDHYEAVGGFDETHLPVSYSDMDYALRQRARGRRVLWTPMLSLFHYESKSRGLDHLSPAKAARSDAERAVVEGRWPGVFDFEPSLNPLWRQASLPHRLLSFPSRQRLWNYIDRTSAAEAWTVAPPLSP